MSLIVAGRFTTFRAAEATADRLFAHGFVEEDVNLFFVNPRGQHARHAAAHDAAAAPPASPHVGRDVTAGAVAGAMLGVLVFGGLGTSLPIVMLAAAVGSYLGARIGANWERDPHPHHEIVHHETRDSGVLLAVHVSPDNLALAAELLRGSGGADIERASGRWQGGHWADFDPTKPPTPYATAQQA